jgi:hypothetical protein
MRLGLVRLNAVAVLRGEPLGTAVGEEPKGVNPKLRGMSAAWATAPKPKTAVVPAIASAPFKNDLERVIVVLKPITKGTKPFKNLKYGV